ncbi:MAG: Ldh family oxidoreductase [Mesorhizobium sp.]|uniref:Ldh family oxidoreductase n=1 Tax=Mesorhizobium sp. TaxID=1871066 RepID=UPI000FE476E4|nr:MAG: Ldh family oxidoreductase [Mesorhizobium sp.]
MVDEPLTIKLDHRRLKQFMVDLMVGAGASLPNAECAADIHVEADLRGVGGQGLDYLPYTLASLERNLIDGHAEPEIVHRSPAAAVIDGRRGPGQVAAVAAVGLAAELAAAAGSATVAVRNSTDIFMIGYYAELLARSGNVGIVMTSGPPLVHPHGGTERLLSTNPIAFGFPTSGPDPYVFDMATSAVASWRVRQAAYEGVELPAGSGRGPDGAPTTDPVLIRQGAISPLCGHKGFGLALSLGLLCGPLTDSGIGPELGGWQASGETHTQGHLFIAINLQAFGSPARISSRATWYLDLLRSSARALDMDGIRIPGERAFQRRRQQLGSSVEILAASWTNLRPFADKYGIEVPAEFHGI